MRCMPIRNGCYIQRDRSCYFFCLDFHNKTMDIENLVKMANDIGNFFNAEPDRAAAVDGVTDHLHKFWDPRMRNTIVAHYRKGGVGLSEISRSAVARLAEESDSLRQTGDG